MFNWLKIGCIINWLLYTRKQSNNCHHADKYHFSRIYYRLLLNTNHFILFVFYFKYETQNDTRALTSIHFLIFFYCLFPTVGELKNGCVVPNVY